MDTRVPPELPPHRSAAPAARTRSRPAATSTHSAGVWLILLLALAAVVGAVVVSSLVPDRYKATASIVKQVTTGPYESVNMDALTRELSTIEQLLLTPDVLDRAAKQRKGESPGSMQAALESSVDPEANLIFVTATAGDPKKAAQIANAVAATFIATQRDVTRRSTSRRARDSSRSCKRPGQPGAAQQSRRSAAALASSASRWPGAGMDLQIAQRAIPPERAQHAQPLRNTRLALFLGLFLGVLVALGRDQLVPRISGARELSRLLELPLLVDRPLRPPAPRPAHAARCPASSTRATRRSPRRCASRCRPIGPARRPRHQRAARRGQEHRHRAARPRARAGRPADPARLGRPALADAARAHSTRRRARAERPAQPSSRTPRRRTRGPALARHQRDRPGSRQRHGELDVLPSGRKPDDPGGCSPATPSTPSSPRSPSSITPTCSSMRRRCWASPTRRRSHARRQPALRRAAGSHHARQRRRRREVLDRLGRPLGMVVIGARSEVSPYYVGLRARARGRLTAAAAAPSPPRSARRPATGAASAGCPRRRCSRGSRTRRRAARSS